MDNQEMKKHIATYKMLQEIPALKMPCPRCGKQQMNADMVENALSRHEDIYTCSECGREESAFDYVGQKKPLELWYAVRFLNGDVLPYERKTPENLKPYYKLSASVTFKVLDEDIDDIMCTALEGGITYWCNRAEIVGDKYLGEYASEQISRGGELRLYDCESDAVYTLTLDKFLRGLATYVSGCYDIAVDGGRVDPGQIDAEGADCIIQYAIFDDVIYG